MTEMHDVVEMLLSRIKDYPEDFVEAPDGRQYGFDDQPWNKWREALNTAYKVATDEEKLALDEATTDAKRAIYMGAALKTIMSEEVPEPPETVKYKSKQYTTGFGVAPIKGEGQTIVYDEYANQIQMLEARRKAELAQMQINSQIRKHVDATNHD